MGCTLHVRNVRERKDSRIASRIFLVYAAKCLMELRDKQMLGRGHRIKNGFCFIFI